MRLECARCHNHPWEKWTQDDFWGFAAFFGRMGVKDTYENDESQILLKAKGEVHHPKTKKPVAAQYLDGPIGKERPGRGYSREARRLDHRAGESLVSASHCQSRC